MKPATFDYHRPQTVDEAVALLAELDDAKILAGGQSLVPLLNLRLAVFAHLVDITRLEELALLERRDGSLRIGATITQGRVEQDPAVATMVPLIGEALPLVGHFPIRNRGTVVGSIAHADPAAELPAVAVALDATIEVTSVRGRRVVAAADFFTGTWTTALADDELVTAVDFPAWDGRCGAAVSEISRRHGDFAVAGACVAVRLDDHDVIDRCAIGLFGLGATPIRAVATEASLTATAVAEMDVARASRAAIEACVDIPADATGSADYRRRVGRVVVARALQTAVERARSRGDRHG